MTTDNLANAGKGNKGKGKTLAHFPFPTGTFDVLPKVIEKGGDGRSARTEWNLEGLKVKGWMKIPRDRLSAATTAMYNTVKRTSKDGVPTMRFISTAVTDDEGKVIMEDVPQVDKDGQPVMVDGKPVIKSMPKEYYIVRVPVVKKATTA